MGMGTVLWERRETNTVLEGFLGVAGTELSSKGHTDKLRGKAVA